MKSYIIYIYIYIYYITYYKYNGFANTSTHQKYFSLFTEASSYKDLY